MAAPEKALLDFMYLNLSRFSRSDSSIFSESYRFSGDETLRPEQLRKYAVHFGSKKLLQVAELFIKSHLLEGTHA